MNRGKWALAFVLLASAPLVSAANPPGEPSTFAAFFQVVVALAVVVAAIAGAAWLMRRALPLASADGHVRVVGGTMVGPRERVVVVEVGDTWIVLGVTATHVNALHTLARPPVSATADSLVGFPSLLARLRKPSP